MKKESPETNATPALTATHVIIRESNDRLPRLSD